jgi:hypothetical protein
VPSCSSNHPKLTFEHLPSEILLNIVTKLPCTEPGTPLRPLLCEHADILPFLDSKDTKNLREASLRVDFLVANHEGSLVRDICCEQFPVASYLNRVCIKDLSFLSGTFRSSKELGDTLEVAEICIADPSR